LLRRTLVDSLICCSMRQPALESSSRKGFAYGTWLAAAVAAWIILWRIEACPVAGLWRDWGFILAVYFLAVFRSKDSKVWQSCTIAVLGLLLTIYASDQVPRILAAHRSFP